jgi:cellobiose phosphorylase
MYRLTVESLLGLHREANYLRIAPCIPSHWQSYKIRYRYLETYYRITLLRAGDPSAQRITLDGVLLTETSISETDQMPGRIPLTNDKQEHLIEVWFN